MRGEKLMLLSLEKEAAAAVVLMIQLHVHGISICLHVCFRTWVASGDFPCLLILSYPPKIWLVESGHRCDSEHGLIVVFYSSISTRINFLLIGITLYLLRDCIQAGLDPNLSKTGCSTVYTN